MAEERKNNLRLWFWRGSAVLLVIVFFVARYFLRDQLPVREVRVGHQEVLNTVSANGRVEPLANYEIHSPIASTVKAVYVTPGEQVPAGKLLLQLDDVQARSRVASAESGVKAAQASLDAALHNGTLQERQASSADIARAQMGRDQAKHDLDALNGLKASGAASAAEVAAAQQRLDSAQAALHAAEQGAQTRYTSVEVDRARAQLAEAQSALAAANEVLAQTAPRSPIAGTVYSLSTNATEFAEEGKTLMEIADLSRERVRGYFDEPSIGQLAIGQKIEIKWDAKPSRSWEGHIVQTPTNIITYGSTRNVGEVLIAIDTPSAELLPDINVTLEVTTSSEPNTLAVPRQAIYSENGKPYVFKVVNDKLVRTSVTIGTPNINLAPILTGLQEGDYVATGTTNGLPLQEGVPIKVSR
jgi:HlyD family secretion protein